MPKSRYDTDMHADMAELLREIRTGSSDFYRTLWGSVERFEELPFVTTQALIETPLRSRSYKEAKGLVKIVRGRAKPFLIKTALEDIRAEQYGTACERPMILFRDNGEALEKTLWFYEHNVLPLIGEPRNMPVSVHLASAVGIDALVTDTESLPLFLSEAKNLELQNIDLTVIGTQFETASALWGSFRTAHMLAGLPETGVFGYLCPHAEARTVHADESALLECVDGELVITKRRLLVTPVIRYQSGLAAAAVSCPCGKDGFSLSYA